MMNVAGFKRCPKCDQWKDFACFSKQASSKDKYRSICRMCVNEQMFAYSRNRYMSLEGRAKQIFNNAKCRAKRDGLNFTVTFHQIKNLIEIGYCPKTGFKFDLTVPEDTQTNPFAPSIDRIDASKGYDFDNVQIVCNIFNMGKGDHRETIFIAMCLAVAERNLHNVNAISKLNELRNA